MQQAVQRGVHRTTVEQLCVILLAVVFAGVLAAAPVHLTSSTTDPQAQAAIDRGLFLYYAYNGDDAERAFSKAAALEPHLAIAYWGLALAAGPDLNTPLTEDHFLVAASAIRKATSVEAGASPLELRLIEIMAMRYHGSFADWSADDAAYRRAMLNFAEVSPDGDVQLLAAEALLEHGGLTWQHGKLASVESQDALRLVSNVLRTNPSSVMANHLCIHLYDLAPDRAPALSCAQRLDAERFSPQAEHLAHMPAHYWIETGAYVRALASSERAYALLMQLTGQEPGSQHVARYTKHDVAVGYSAATMLGNYATAQRWSERMTSAFGTSFEALTALRFGRFEAAYAASEDGFAGLSVRGLAALHLSHIAEARAVAQKLRFRNATEGYFPQIFLAELAAADGKFDEAERWIERSRTNQRNVFSGELIPIIPADEALGAIRLRHGDDAGAVAAFREALAAYPQDPRALFGLMQALSASGALTEAAAARAGFEKEWEGADTNVGDALP